MRPRSLAITLAACSATAALTALALAQPNSAPPASPQADPVSNMGQLLIDGLRSTEGCLGVEAAQMQFSQMNTIIAWFKDKESAKRWYHHETHKRLVNLVQSTPDDHEPLAHVADGTPVMVMASIQFTSPDKSVLPGPMPISKISIEMYTPLPGGAMVAGRLAPMDFPIPHMDGYPTTP